MSVIGFLSLIGNFDAGGVVCGGGVVGATAVDVAVGAGGPPGWTVAAETPTLPGSFGAAGPAVVVVAAGVVLTAVATGVAAVVVSAGAAGVEAELALEFELPPPDGVTT